MKALNDLLKTFENIEFWQKVNFPFKLNSLLFFKTPKGIEVLRKKYCEFNYKIPSPQSHVIGKTEGENRLYKRKSKTIKSFLNE